MLNFLKVRSKKVEVNPGKGTWASIELKKLVSQWFKHPNENLGLVIQTYDNEGRKDFAVVEPFNNDQSLVC